MLKRLTERPKYQGPLTRRARMILACAEGKPDTVVAQETGMCPRSDEVARSISCATLKGLDDRVSHPNLTVTRVQYDRRAPELNWTDFSTSRRTDHCSPSL
jgi:hypothetical protein